MIGPLFRLGALFCALSFAAPAFADVPVQLRARIEASGPAITLGDVFDGAGAAASQFVAPAPPAGQIARLSPQVLQAAASAAGLSWQAPAGVRSINVVNPGGARAMLAPARADGAYVQTSASDAAVRRGQAVTLTFDAPGVRLALRGRAVTDGAVGETVQVVNLSSNRTVDAVVTGPGAASVSAQ